MPTDPKSDRRPDWLLTARWGRAIVREARRRVRRARRLSRVLEAAT